VPEQGFDGPGWVWVVASIAQRFPGVVESCGALWVVLQLAAPFLILF